MSVISRIKAIFEAKVEKGLDAVEDPKEMLDLSLKKMEDNLRSLTESAVEVATAKKRLEIQRGTIAAKITKYEEQAKKAIELGQEDLAREALEKKAQAGERLKVLDEEILTLANRTESIAMSQAELRHQIELFRGRKEELKAAYDASRAELKVKEAVTAAGTSAADVGRMVDSAKARIEEMQARAKAIDELVGEGVISDVFAGGTDDTERKLDRLSSQAAVEAELARLKADMAGNETTPANEKQPAEAAGKQVEG